MFSYFPAGTLTASLLWNLSQEITTEEDLLTLGLTGLKLSGSVIQTALTDSQRSINIAAHTVLQKWLQQYKNTEEAFTDLQAALRQCKMSNLASKLVTGFGDDRPERQPSKQREYLFLMSESIMGMT